MPSLQVRMFSVFVPVLAVLHLGAAHHTGHLLGHRRICKDSGIMHTSWPANAEVSEEVIMIPNCLYVPTQTTTLYNCNSHCYLYSYFSHYWRTSSANYSPMTFTNVLETVIIVGMQSRQWDSTVFNDAEELGN